MTAADNETLPLCLLLAINVSDSADVGEILGHWAGCAVLFFLTLSVSQSAVPPLSAASPLRALRLLPS